ncbi:MAG: tyrosine-type recombinase/integrase [Deltaproteobacteria bacterium]|nr:MAG: tyrosine-type recombinase/integrase [Deltaproteobacteria bacterium]
MKLAPCIHQFFHHYLPNIRGMSHHTIVSYRDTFKLFVPFAAQYYGVKVNSLRLAHISSELIIAFLDHLQQNRHNLPKTRNLRLATLKSFAKMIRLVYPDHREMAEKIIHIPQKRFQRSLVGFLYQEEIFKVFQSVDLGRKEGFRDYTLLHLLYDSGARASEISTLNLDYFNPNQQTIAILGKGDRFRIITLENKTSELLELYIKKYRITPKPLYQKRIFISQRGEQLSRHGIYRICKKYLIKTLPPKRLKIINPVHSFRHSRAMDLLYRGHPLTDIQNRLGHDNLQSTSIYLHLDLNRRRYIQREFIRHMDSVLTVDPKIEQLLQWECKEDILAWLDKL